MKKIWLVIMFLALAGKVEGVGNEGRYTTIVNPVRGRNLWVNQDLNLLRKQYEPIKKEGLKATWLVQYDVLSDEELLEEMGKFDSNQEMGLFLEISPKLARTVRVNYKPQRPWYKPDVVFLSGYDRNERGKLIDEMFDRFEREFGFWPKAVGAWWIDSWSLNYMEEKYGVKIALIVADQKTTDNYGVWGQWWGSPYRASKYNILTPGDGVTVIQWALRDPELATGEGPEFSNYSLQANDYLERGLTIDYFKSLAERYLATTGQITMGLEVGMEGANNLEEYSRQIEWTAENTEPVTMSEFAEKFEPVEKVRIGDWEMERGARVNESIGEEIKYEPKVAFSDYFVADNNDFLDRKLPLENQRIRYLPYWILVWLGWLAVAIKIKKYKWWVWGSLFLGLGFGGLLRSKWELGWWVFYGPAVKNLSIMQILATTGVMGLFWRLSARGRQEKGGIMGWLVLAFFVGPIIRVTRVSMIEGEYLMGIMISGFRFVGVGIKNGIRFLNQDLESGVALAFLEFNLKNYWMEMMAKVLMGMAGLWLVNKLPKRWRRVMMGMVMILVLMELWWVLTGDSAEVLL